jgi:hypothetical protein
MSKYVAISNEMYARAEKYSPVVWLGTYLREVLGSILA